MVVIAAGTLAGQRRVYKRKQKELKVCCSAVALNPKPRLSATRYPCKSMLLASDIWPYNTYASYICTPHTHATVAQRRESDADYLVRCIYQRTAHYTWNTGKLLISGKESLLS
jgi:hypothetical protein